MKTGEHSFKHLKPSNLFDTLKLEHELNRKMEHFDARRLYEVWLPKKTVMRFFDYGETQMRELEKENSLITSKIKSRKFYSVASILNLIENNKIAQ